MSSLRRYILPVEQTGWRFKGENYTDFTWNYDPERTQLLKLYENAKNAQWDQKDRIDWSINLDPENPLELDDRVISIYGTDMWNKMTPKEKAKVRYHTQVFNLSQLMHGEQGALIAASRIVQVAPDIDAKFYAATQVMDEARHLETYSRLLREKFEFAYPMTGPLKQLLEQGLTDSRWDMTYLSMQVLIEGLALAAFQRLRDNSKNPLTISINAYVMQDEARHVAFGRLALRDYYKNLSDSEKAVREEFLIEGCYLMRDKIDAREVWEHLDLDVKKCLEAFKVSENMQFVRKSLFSRIVPIVKDIGLWSPKVQAAFQDMGVIDFSKIDVEERLKADEDWAQKLDQQRADHVKKSA